MPIWQGGRNEPCTQSVLFPDPILNAQDGPVMLPFDAPQEEVAEVLV